MSKTFTAYYRVSTVKQGQSGLGLEAQRAAAQAYAGKTGAIVAEFVEVETGKNNNGYSRDTRLSQIWDKQVYAMSRVMPCEL
jgi:DNA invertase Pin-like site-specific DNA recombinase